MLKHDSNARTYVHTSKPCAFFYKKKYGNVKNEGNKNKLKRIRSS